MTASVTMRKHAAEITKKKTPRNHRRSATSVLGSFRLSSTRAICLYRYCEASAMSLLSTMDRGRSDPRYGCSTFYRRRSQTLLSHERNHIPPPCAGTLLFSACVRDRTTVADSTASIWRPVVLRAKKWRWSRRRAHVCHIYHYYADLIHLSSWPSISWLLRDM